MITKASVVLSPLTVLVTCLLVSCADGGIKEDGYNLHDYLFNKTDPYGYNKDVRPGDDNTGSLLVFLEFNLLSLVDVNEKEQKLVTAGRLGMVWFDIYLSWNPNEFSGIDSILVRQKKVWLPDIVVANSVTSSMQLGYDDLLVRIYSYGAVYWQPSIIMSTSCNIDVTFYPFDTQVCDVDFETAMSNPEEVFVCIDKTDPVKLEDYSLDGQWDLVDTSAQNLGASGNRSKIRFSLLLKRQRTFYIVNIITPIMLLSLTATLVFALPADGGEKMGLGITVLLAYAVYLTIVTDYLPSTSRQISLLAVYLIILLGITGVGVVTSVFILRLHHRPDSELVGSIVARFTFFLRAITCRSKSKNADHPVKKSSSPENHANHTAYRGPPRLPADSGDPPVDYETLTWQDVAETLDWFLFLLFSIISILTTIGCIVALDVGAAVFSPTLNKTTVGCEDLVFLLRNNTR